MTKTRTTITATDTHDADVFGVPSGEKYDAWRQLISEAEKASLHAKAAELRKAMLDEFPEAKREHFDQFAATMGWASATGQA